MQNSRGKRSWRVDPSLPPRSNYGLSPGLLKFYGPADSIKQGQFQNDGPTLHSSKGRICNSSSKVESRDKSTRLGEGSKEITSDLQSRIWNGSSRIESRDKSTRNCHDERSEEIKSVSGDRIWNGSSMVESRDKATRNCHDERSKEIKSVSGDRIWNGSSRVVSRDKATRNCHDERSKEIKSVSGDRIWNGSSRVESRDKSTRNCHDERSEEIKSVSGDRIWNGSSRIESRDKPTRNCHDERSEEIKSVSVDRIWNGSSRVELRDKATRNGDYERLEEITSDPRGRIRGGSSRTESRDKSTGKGNYEGSEEITRGPRVNRRNDSLDSVSVPSSLPVLGDKYNLAEFQTEYERAKFYVIKSFGEDDVHKCIKYNVWSSTPFGNKKLDAAFQDAETQVGEFGKCPIFLFFSVNGSGQFTGLAEMVGKVDFNKTMDFWKLDKWSGFFPVKWHIIKDIPNGQLRHIILENNDNRAVTFTRDTQEVGLNQGLKMLKIFKSYPAKSSLLDDYEFYEERLKALDPRKSSKPVTRRTNGYTEYSWNYSDDTAIKGEASAKINRVSNHSSPLVDLTKRLSINSSEHKVGR